MEDKKNSSLIEFIKKTNELHGALSGLDEAIKELYDHGIENLQKHAEGSDA